MATKSLKKILGDGGAGFDQSHGSDTLYDVLKAMLDYCCDTLNGYQAAIATGIVASMVVEKAGVIRSLTVDIAVCGSAGATTVQVRKNGVSVDSVTVQNTDPDGTYKVELVGVSAAVGDLIDINVSAAPTGGTGLSASVRITPDLVAE